VKRRFRNEEARAGRSRASDSRPLPIEGVMSEQRARASQRHGPFAKGDDDGSSRRDCASGAQIGAAYSQRRGGTVADNPLRKPESQYLELSAEVA
jgi:hypothetical protein